MSEPSFFSHISSFFGGSSSNKTLGSNRRTTTFGNGLPSSSRRGPPESLDPSAWSLPYSNTNNIPASPAGYMNGSGMNSPVSGHYPPSSGRAPSPYANDQPRGAMSTSSVAEFSNMHPASSSSALNQHNNMRVSAGSAVPSSTYPPMRHTWSRIRKWCNKKYPEVGDTLNWPCTHDALDDLEMTIGYALPACVRESYLTYNGQESESNQSCSDGIFFGATLLSLDQIAEEWRFWRSVDEDPETGANPDVRSQMTSCPHKWVRAEYSCRGWIPLITDRAGNYIGIDLSPHPSGAGSAGQVIIFGRDFDTKVVCWKGEGEGGWGRFLQAFADELDAGEFCTLDDNSGSDDEEDMIGYESYFSGGGGGGSKGGGDRGGEGSPGFQLAGLYKGWPVLEAWADRSMRMWESVGLVAGNPGAPPRQHQTQEETQQRSMMGGGNEDDTIIPPGLQALDDVQPAYNIQESGPSRSMVGKEVVGDVSVDGPAHPLADSSLPGDTSDASLLTTAANNTYSDTQTADNGSDRVAPITSTRRPSGMLSPPLPETKASLRKQKQREEGWGSPVMNQGTSPHIPQQQLPNRRKPTRPAPAPVALLDLPTIEDVNAVRAAVMADDGWSHNVQFEANPGRSSFGNMGFRDLASKISAGSNTASKHRDESVELENRRSGDESRTEAAEDTSASNSYIVGSRGRARGLGNDSSVDLPNATAAEHVTDSHQDTMKAFNMMSLSTPTDKRSAQMSSLIDTSSVPNSPRLGSAHENEVSTAIA